ncbi:MAG: osmotically inducible protein OsmC [Epsilonproteobacteria bacterium]|nr:osmotically inducible protein OsmC [Campylobacterota bacterium]NPA89736.1 OsmC family protein [Campylobacterota bacterium]
MIKIDYLENGTFQGSNGRSVIKIDPQIYSPVELFVTGMGSCSAVDVVELAKKQGVDIRNFSLEVEFERRDTFPKIFTSFHLIYKFESPVEDIKAKRWVLSSLETYCSTINTLRATSKIYYTIIHNGETIAYKESIVSGNGGGVELESFDDDLDGLGCACCNS